MTLTIRSPKNYFKPTGRSGTGGRFSKPQTGGMAAVDALRRQTEPQLRHLERQSRSIQRTRKDYLDSDQRRFELQKDQREANFALEQEVGRLAIQNTRKRGELEYKAAMGKAVEYEKESKFWENFSTTYAKQWASLAQNVYSTVDKQLAFKDFQRIHELGLTENLIPDENPANADFKKKREEISNEIATILSTPGPLTTPQKEYVKANLKLIGSTGWELQQLLVDQEISNSELRFEQMRDVLGDQYNAEDAVELAEKLSFMVSVRAGISDPSLQHKLFLHYSGKANSKATAAYNVRHHQEAKQTFQKHLKLNENFQTGELTTVLSSIKAITNKHNGTPLYATWPEALYHYIDEAVAAGHDPDKLLPYILEENIPGSTTITWGKKNKGIGLERIQNRINEAVTKKQNDDLKKDRADTKWKDLEQAKIYGQQYINYKAWKNSNLPFKEWQKQNPGIEILDPNDPRLPSMIASAATGSRSEQILSTIYQHSKYMERSRLEERDLRFAIHRGDIAEAEWMMNSMDLTDDQKNGYRGMIDISSNVKKAIGSYIFNDTVMNKDSKKIIESVLNGIPGVTVKEDESTMDAVVDYYTQSVRHYFWDDPVISKEEDPLKRLDNAKAAARADLDAGEGLWRRPKVGAISTTTRRGMRRSPVINLVELFPAFSSRHGYYNWEVMGDTPFKEQLNTTEVADLGGKEQPWWLADTSWMEHRELDRYAKYVLQGTNPGDIIYSDRVKAIAEKLGENIHPYQVVNMILEEEGYTERLPIDISQVNSDLQVKFLRKNREPWTSRIKVEPGSTYAKEKLRYRGSPKENMLYASEVTFPTRIMYYELLEFIKNNNVGVEVK